MYTILCEKFPEHLARYIASFSVHSIDDRKRDIRKRRRLLRSICRDHRINQNCNFIEWSRQVGIRGFVRASRHQQEISKRLLEFVSMISLDADDDAYPCALSVAILHIRIELDCELSIEQYGEFVHKRVDEILNPQ
jgi:hypothetical protein